MTIREFAMELAELVRRAPLATGLPIRWTFIANAKAGGFTIRKRWAAHSAVIQRYAEAARLRPLRPAGAEPSATARELDPGDGSLGAIGLLLTQRPAHAGEIVQAILDEAAADLAASAKLGPAARPAPFQLLITAGGDGTSLEALTTLFAAPPELRARFAVIRLPMGTGNDGADARELDKALDKLTLPTAIEYRRAVRLRTNTPGKGPFLAFNILSIGLDAFVTRMANRMKNIFPGDSYKLWVDLATLFYDSFYKVKSMTVRAECEATGYARTTGQTVNQELLNFTDHILLLAVGVSGKRTYGANKKILPDERNVCAVKNINVFRKIALKELFTSGRHADRPEARLFSADRLYIDYSAPLLAQMDGEDIELVAEDFPIVIELTEPVIPGLRFSSF